MKRLTYASWAVPDLQVYLLLLRPLRLDVEAIPPQQFLADLQPRTNLELWALGHTRFCMWLQINTCELGAVCEHTGCMGGSWKVIIVVNPVEQSSMSV